MLSYQHFYHAGNHVDCQKHIVLAHLMECLKQKETPFRYLDTHSGRGLYDLCAPEAQKIREHETGITRIWDKKPWPEDARAYRQVLDSLNKDGQLRFYPGSPFVAQALSRPQDRIELYELHPQEVRALDDTMGKLANVEIFQEDGWSILGKYLPPKENRGLVFIDPSYELKEDFMHMAEALQHALKYWRSGIFVIWYPILKQRFHEAMKHDFIESGIRKVLCSEIFFSDQPPEKGIWGTGLLVINPPWKSDAVIASLSEWLTGFIGTKTETSWLIPE